MEEITLSDSKGEFLDDLRGLGVLELDNLELIVFIVSSCGGSSFFAFFDRLGKKKISFSIFSCLKVCVIEEFIVSC